MEKLAKLKEKGIFTEKEFNAKKENDIRNITNHTPYLIPKFKDLYNKLNILDYKKSILIKILEMIS